MVSGGRSLCIEYHSIRLFNLFLPLKENFMLVRFSAFHLVAFLFALVCFGSVNNANGQESEKAKKNEKVENQTDSAAKKDLLSFVPDESFLVIQSSAKDLWSTLNKDNLEVLEEVTDALAGRVGLGAGDIEEVLFGMTTLTNEKNEELSIPFFLAFRWSKSVNRDDVLAAFNITMDKEVLGGIPVKRRGNLEGGPVVCFPGKRILILSEMQVLEKMMGKKKGCRIVKRLQQLKKKSVAAGVLELNGEEERLEILGQFLKFPFELVKITELNDVFENAKYLELSTHKGDTFAKGTFIANTKSDCTEAIEIATDSKESAVDFFDSRIDQLQGRGEWGKAGIKILTMVKKIIQSVKFKQNGKEASIEVSYPGGYKAITNRSIVLLPEPILPMIPIFSPDSMLNDTSVRAVVLASG